MSDTTFDKGVVLKYELHKKQDLTGRTEDKEGKLTFMGGGKRGENMWAN